MHEIDELLRGELIGLKVEVINSKDRSKIGIKGTIIDETKNMLIIDKGRKVVKIPKDICEFKIHTKKGIFLIEGKLLKGRPEERLKMKFNKK